MTEYEFQRRYLFLDGKERDKDLVWKNAADHRNLVTRITIEAGNVENGRLAVLGPGPCNDIDLNAIKSLFSEVHLMDLDGAACWQGLDHQNLTQADWIKIHGNTDVTGVGSRLAELAGKPISDQQIDELIDQILNFRMPEYSEYFDAVISTCLLSQLNDHAIRCIGDGHPRMVDLLTAIRVGHVKLINDLCKPGGNGIVIFDFVSSGTLPGLEGFKGEDLRKFLSKAIENRNFFHGMNPVMINETMVHDERIKDQICNVTTALPWVWNMTKRYYAVTAIRFNKVR